MMHELAKINWGGMAFVLGIFPITGLATVLLRKWGESGTPAQPRGKIAGGVRVLVPATRPLPSNAIDSSNYQPPPHIHVYDIARSQVVLCGDGTAQVSCAVHGCSQVATSKYRADETLPGFTNSKGTK